MERVRNYVRLLSWLDFTKLKPDECSVSDRSGSRFPNPLAFSFRFPRNDERKKEGASDDFSFVPSRIGAPESFSNSVVMTEVEERSASWKNNAVRFTSAPWILETQLDDGVDDDIRTLEAVEKSRVVLRGVTIMMIGDDTPGAISLSRSTRFCCQPGKSCYTRSESKRAREREYEMVSVGVMTMTRLKKSWRRVE